MALTLNGSSGITYPDNTVASTAYSTRFRNRIINGDMRIDQRNAGNSITSAGNVYTVDRFFIQGSPTGKFNVQQNQGSVTPPAGFLNYLGCTSNSAYSISSGDYFIIRQAIEGLNCADLGWGTASAKTVTLSFYVYSSLTGTFSGHLTNSSSARWYPYTYTVSSANTWTYVSVTIPGDTTGTWLTNTGTGIYVGWSLGTGSSNQAAANAWTASTGIAATGSVNVVSTNGATFYITGVQLEVGSSATGFEYVDYGTQLLMCQRYFERTYDIGTATGAITSAGSITTFPALYATYFPYSFKVTKRATPTITGYSPSSGTAGNWSINNSSDGTITGIISGGMNSVCAYVAPYNQNISAYLHYTISSEL